VAPVLLILLRMVQGVALRRQWGGAALVAFENAPRPAGRYGVGMQRLPAGQLLASGLLCAFSRCPTRSSSRGAGGAVPVSAVLLGSGYVASGCRTPCSQRMEGAAGRPGCRWWSCSARRPAHGAAHLHQTGPNSRTTCSPFTRRSTWDAACCTCQELGADRGAHRGAAEFITMPASRGFLDRSAVGTVYLFRVFLGRCTRSPLLLAGRYAQKVLIWVRWRSARHRALGVLLAARPLYTEHFPTRSATPACLVRLPGVQRESRGAGGDRATALITATGTTGRSRSTSWRLPRSRRSGALRCGRTTAPS